MVDTATKYCAQALTVGTKVRFSGTLPLLGGLSDSTVYYISSVVNGSSFTISTGTGNGVYNPVALTPTAFSRCIVTTVTGASFKCDATVTVTSRDANGLFTSSTTLESFTVGQQVKFTGTAFGGVTATVGIYFIRSIEGTLKFTISVTEGGNAIYDGASYSGSMTMSANPFTASKFSVGGRVRFFARDDGGTFATVAGTGVSAGTTYYIKSITKLTNQPHSFSISATAGGTDISASSGAAPGWIMMTWSDTTLSIYGDDATTETSSKMNVRFGKASVVGNFDASIGSMSISARAPDFNFNKESKTFGRSDLVRVISCTTTLVTFESGSAFDVGDSLIFTGSFGNIVASRPYLIKSLSLSSGTSSTNVAVELTLHPGAGVFDVASSISAVPPDTFAYSTQIQSSVQCTSSSAPTYALTCSSVSALVVPDAVVFVSNNGNFFGGVAADTVYFVRKILSHSQLVLSESANGPALALTTGSGSMTMTKASAVSFQIASCTSTTLTCSAVRCALSFNVSSPIVFEKPVICGIVAGQTYFVYSIVSSTVFSISTFIGATTALTLTVASGGTMPFYRSRGIIQPDFSNFQRHLVPVNRNSAVRISNQRPLPAAGCSACKSSQSALMCSPRNIRNNQNSLETVTSNSTVSVGQFVEFTLEASFLFYDCGTAASEQIVFGRDTNSAKKIKVIWRCRRTSFLSMQLLPQS